MVKYETIIILRILFPFVFSFPLFITKQAFSKCDNKKTECKDSSGKTTDCCTSSQICKNGRCYYPGELMLMEEKKAKKVSESPVQSNGKAEKDGKDGKDEKSNTERIKILGKMLLENEDFKVRVQAAFSLAKIPDKKILPYLFSALKDKHPTVRTAAATALGNTQDPEVLDVLYKYLDKDPNPMVNEAIKEAIIKVETDPVKIDELQKLPPVTSNVSPSQVKYLFVIGNMEDSIGSGRKNLGGIFKRFLLEQLKTVNNSMIVVEGDPPKEVLQRIDKGKAYGFYFSSSLKQLEGGWDSSSGYVVNAKVSIICSSYPGRVLAMTLNSSASSSITKSGFRKNLIPKLEENAIKGTIESMAQSIKENLDRLSNESQAPSKGKGKKR